MPPKVGGECTRTYQKRTQNDLGIKYGIVKDITEKPNGFNNVEIELQELKEVSDAIIHLDSLGATLKKRPKFENVRPWWHS